jgi:hypothetical protein
MEQQSENKGKGKTEKGEKGKKKSGLCNQCVCTCN